MRAVSWALAICLFAAPAAALPSVDLATITHEEIERLVTTVGNNDTERDTIRKRLTSWKDLLTSPKNRDLAETEKLRLVNDFMHQTPFYCDPAMWCMEDFWAKPVEFLANDGGDCEDFAIAKYFTLKALGVADERLRIVYAVYQRGGPGGFTGAHMVLAYYSSSDADPLILDNINQDILPASNRPDLIPIFSFNSGGLWSAREQKGRGNAPDHYRAWGDHWRRVQKDDVVRSISPDQRRSPECQTLMGRTPWCR
jgi:predicted transglutaminase-like cysteine proteinase